MKFVQAILPLKQWCSERAVPSDKVTIVISIADRKTADDFEAALARDIAEILKWGKLNLSVPAGAFDLLGFHFRIERPE